MSGRRRKQRIKLKCWLCGMVFNYDYLSKHNRKYHFDILFRDRCISYEWVDAPLKPFEVTNKSKQIMPFLSNLRYLAQTETILSKTFIGLPGFYFCGNGRKSAIIGCRFCGVESGDKPSQCIDLMRENMEGDCLS